MTSTRYRRPLLGLIEHLPDCVPVLFDRCITHSHADRTEKEFHVNTRSASHESATADDVLLFVLSGHLRFSLHQLDGHYTHRWQRGPIAHASTERRFINEDNGRVSLCMSSPVDDGQIRSHESFEPSTMRDLASREVALVRLSNLHAESVLLPSLSCGLLLLHCHFSLVQPSRSYRLEQFLARFVSQC